MTDDELFKVIKALLAPMQIEVSKILFRLEKVEQQVGSLETKHVRHKNELKDIHEEIAALRK